MTSKFRTWLVKIYKKDLLLVVNVVIRARNIEETNTFRQDRLIL